MCKFEFSPLVLSKILDTKSDVQNMFQAKIDQHFEGCEGAIGIAKDIVVVGKSEEEHNRCMHGIVARSRTTRLKLNPGKYKIKQETVELHGLICGEDGIQPDLEKVSALKIINHHQTFL